ncbi:MAG: PEP-CTERM sorting domain-containing protein [Verrucomicrobiales bacterium]
MLAGSYRNQRSLIAVGVGSLRRGITSFEGQRQIGNNGASGTLGAGNVTINDGATLAVSRSDSYAAGNAISGAGGLRQIGSGSTTLTGTNRYLGMSEVLAGTLLVNGDQTGATGAVNVSAGATLGGTGIVGGVVTVDGDLAPGTGPGILTLVNALTMNSSSTYLVEIDGTAAWDLTRATGVTLNNPALDITLLNQPSPGFQYPILENTSAPAIAGTFNGLSEGAAFVDDGWNWSITYAGGSGNDAVLTAVSPIPEPTQLALLAGAIALAIRRRRQTHPRAER